MSKANIPPALLANVRGAVVDAVSAHLPREHVASVCRAILDEEDGLPCALTVAYCGLPGELRSEDQLLDLLAVHIDGMLGTETRAAGALRLRAHELRISALERELREEEARLWRAERGVE